MKKTELLSPAGNLETLKIAVQNGADAIYMAGKKFGARAFSENFNDDEIIMSYTKYNEIFNTNYNSLNYHEFTPVEVSFTYYYFYDLNKEKAVYTVDLTITKLIDGNVFYVSDYLGIEPYEVISVINPKLKRVIR